MKTEFMLLGYIAGKSMPHLLCRDGNFISYNGPEILKLAKRWSTRAGVERFILGEQKAGTVFGYLVLPVEKN